MKTKKLSIIIFWAVILSLSTYFYVDNVLGYFSGYRNERFESNQIWFVAHMIGATFSLFLGPVQFWPSIRKKYVSYHRIAGMLYIIGSIVAGISALRLTFIYDCIGCRYSLVVLSILFLLTTSLAWVAIKRKNIVGHRQFMVRSYTCALAFVFIRLYQILPLDFLYSAMDDPELQRTVNEWLFSFVPIIAVEIGVIWIPSITRKNVS